MLANDTGPLHLAAALGRPVVAPYTCTQVRCTGPYGAGGRGRRESRLVPGQLSQTLRRAGVHGRADAGPAVAGPAGGLAAMGEPSPFRLILASGSPARRELLEQAGYSFEVLPADIDEPTEAGFDNPRHFVQHVAWLKAAAVAPQVAEGIVLAADTVGWLDGQVIGKPADEADARRILRLLGGTHHELWTGVTLWRRPDDLQVVWQEQPLVPVQRR